MVQEFFQLKPYARYGCLCSGGRFFVIPGHERGYAALYLFPVLIYYRYK